jgi:3-isopropylmalate dehydrogenase
LAPSGNIHPGRTSLFEPVHGSAPNIAGKGVANPLGSVLTSAMLLEFLGWGHEAKIVRDAVKAALGNNHLTPDLGGKSSTVAVGDWLASRVASQLI